MGVRYNANTNAALSPLFMCFVSPASHRFASHRPPAFTGRGGDPTGTVEGVDLLISHPLASAFSPAPTRSATRHAPRPLSHPSDVWIQVCRLMSDSVRPCYCTVHSLLWCILKGGEWHGMCAASGAHARVRPASTRCTRPPRSWRATSRHNACTLTYSVVFLFGSERQHAQAPSCNDDHSATLPIVRVVCRASCAPDLPPSSSPLCTAAESVSTGTMRADAFRPLIGAPTPSLVSPALPQPPPPGVWIMIRSPAPILVVFCSENCQSQNAVLSRINALLANLDPPCRPS